MRRIDGPARGFEFLEDVADFLTQRNDVLLRRRIGIALAGALESLPNGREPPAHDDGRDHGGKRRSPEGNARQGEEEIVSRLPAALVGIAQVVQDNEMPHPPTGIQGKGADQDVVILVPDDREAFRVGPGCLGTGEGRRHIAGGEAQFLPFAIADSEHPLVRGDALEQDPGLLCVVAGQEAADLIPDGVEHEARSQLDVTARPLLHEGRSKGQHGQDDDGRHEHCDTAKAEDDPQNAKFLKKTNTAIEAGRSSLAAAPWALSSIEGCRRAQPPPCYGLACGTFQA
jgi:hypothetical protein